MQLAYVAQQLFLSLTNPFLLLCYDSDMMVCSRQLLDRYVLRHKILLRVGLGCIKLEQLLSSLLRIRSWVRKGTCIAFKYYKSDVFLITKNPKKIQSLFLAHLPIIFIMQTLIKMFTVSNEIIGTNNSEIFLRDGKFSTGLSFQSFFHLPTNLD